MRTIEEIKADMNLAQGCMCNRHDCDNKCEKCDYLNYDKYYYKLKEENYQWYVDQNKRKAAVDGIPTVRLEWICSSEKDRRCLVLPCKVGDVVYRIFNGEIETRLVSNAIYESFSKQWKVFTTPYMCIYWEDSFGKTVFFTREEAEAALGQERSHD